MALSRSDKTIDFIDRKSLTFGFAVIGAILVVICAYILIAGSAALRKNESLLSSQTVVINFTSERPDAAVEQPEQSVPPKGIETHHDEKQDHDDHNNVAHNDHSATEPSTPAEDLKPAQPVKPLLETKKDGPLSSAPDPNIIEKTAAGSLPIVSGTGQSPFLTYKKPFYDDIQKPVIALAVVDFGLSEKVSSDMLRAFPSEISFILNPYIQDADTWQKKAREHGHEVWLQLPIQNSKFPLHDYGPNTLLSQASLSYNQDLLLKTLATTTGYAGVAAETDNVFLESKPMFQALLRSIFDRGLGYYELNTDGPLYVETFALNNNTPYMRNQITVDGTKEQVAEQLKKLEGRAKGQGFSLGHIVAKPSAVPIINAWAASLKKNDFVLAPLSYISVAQNQRPRPLNAPPEEIKEVEAIPVKTKEQ